MMEEPWWERLSRLQKAKGWSNRETARNFIAASPAHLDGQLESVVAQLKRYRRGEVADPEHETKAAIARMFDLPVADFFPTQPLASAQAPTRPSPDEFTDLVSALRRPQVGAAQLAQTEAEVERLCTAYASQDAASLTAEVDQWMHELTGLTSRVGLQGQQQVHQLAGYLSLLRSCLMWDQGDEKGAQHARVAAEGLAEDLGDGVIAAWTWEIRSWMALTQGDMPAVIRYAQVGIQHAPRASVAAQLWAQQAKAYSRLRDTHKTHVALENVRAILDGCEIPTNTRNHFAVDPTKASFYAMDAYRMLPGSERLAEAMADTVIGTSVRLDGTAISPMRLAEAQLTKAVLAARDGTADDALSMADTALNHDRRSAPSLLLVAGEVARELDYRAPTAASEFRDHLQHLNLPKDAA